MYLFPSRLKNCKLTTIRRQVNFFSYIRFIYDALRCNVCDKIAMDFGSMPRYMFILMYDNLGKEKPHGEKTMKNILMSLVGRILTSAQKVKGLASAN